MLDSGQDFYGGNNLLTIFSANYSKKKDIPYICNFKTLIIYSLCFSFLFGQDNWINVFAPIVPVTSIHNLIPKGSGGPRSGSLRLVIVSLNHL